MQCPADDRQILADFKSFPTIDLQHLRQEVPHRFSNRGGLIHYAIINNHVYRRTLGKYTDFKMFSDEMLLSLTRKVELFCCFFHAVHHLYVYKVFIVTHRCSVAGEGA